MFRVTREIDFCYGHRLIDYPGKCRHLHGHNGIAIFTLEGETLDERGMLIDFGDIKRLLKGWIDEHFDHKLLLHAADPLVKVLRDFGEPVYTLEQNPTAENIARHLFLMARQLELPVVNVDFHETPTCVASYRSGSSSRG